MLKVLPLLLVLIFSWVTVHAATYSCRDKQGQLHVTDNLQTLPEGCLNKAQIVKSDDPDNLNYVPSKATPAGAGHEFQQTVNVVERGQQQKETSVAYWLTRSGQLAEQYRLAVQKKRSATRRWSYESRDIIKAADDQIAKARAGKQELLTQMGNVRISRDDEKKIVSRLDEIGD